jgi:hypothetical protein
MSAPYLRRLNREGAPYNKTETGAVSEINLSVATSCAVIMRPTLDCTSYACAAPCAT